MIFFIKVVTVHRFRVEETERFFDATEELDVDRERPYSCDVMKLKKNSFPDDRSFVKGIHQSPVDSPQAEPVTRILTL